MDWTAYPAGSYLVEGFVGDEEFINPMTYSNGSDSAQSAQDSQGTQNADGAQSDKSQESGTGLVPWEYLRPQATAPARAARRAGDAIHVRARLPKQATPSPLTPGSFLMVQRS